MTHVHTVPRSRTLGWVLLGLLFYFGFLAAGAPASVLGRALAHATNQGVTLESPSGGFWRGRAGKLNIVDTEGRTHSFERLRWEWRGARLLAGELAFQIEIADPKLRGSTQIALQPGAARVSDATFDLAASTLEAHWPRRFRAGLTGDLALRSPVFQFDRGNFSGEATLTWRKAGSTSMGYQVGDYVARIRGADQHVEYRVETVGGTLHVDGKGEWSSDTGLSFDGTVRSLAGDRAALLDNLKQFGAESAGGVHRIRFSTRPRPIER